MSFEGTYELLCENGHLHFEDCYIFVENGWKCSICQAKLVWWHLVDETNDGGDWTKFRVRQAGRKCKECGQKTEPDTYHIPKKGHKIQ